MEWPSTIAGWAGFIFAAISIIVIIGGIVIKLAKSHIDNRINSTMEFAIKKAVMLGMVPVNAQLEVMQIQLNSQDTELARIRPMETKLNNGIIERQERIEDKVDQLIEHHLLDRKKEGDQ